MIDTSYRSVQQAVQELKSYSPSTARDVVLATAANTAAGKTVDAKGEIIRTLMRVIDGGTQISDVVKALSLFAGENTADMEKLVAIYTESPDGLTLTSLGDRVNGTLDKTNTRIMFAQVFPAEITPAVRQADEAVLFMTAVPQHELSRAVPRLDIRVITQGPSRSPISQVGFLVGAGGTVIDAALSTASDVQLTDFDRETGLRATEPSSHHVSGMEIFTSPQTMQSLDGRSIDPFRPLLSVKSVEFDVIPTTGMMSYKSGKIHIVLHDRARLADVAELVKPDMFQYTELLIDYGWNHPDPINNVYGALINGMRTREKYGVQNSSFTFSEGGQVDIILEIFMKGVVDFSTTKIAQSREIDTAVQTLQKLVIAVGNLRSRSSLMKDVKGASLIDSVSDISSAMMVDGDILKAVKKFIGKNSSGTDKDAQDLAEALKEIYVEQKDKKVGAVKDLQGTLLESFDSKLKSLGKGSPDPMLERIMPFDVGPDFLQGNVSLGKLFHRFVAEPLTSTGAFSEVHFIFYGFNSGAGLVRHKNIGSFPINVKDFTTQFTKYIEKRGRFNIALGEFINYIANNFIDDYSNWAYGMSDVGVNRSEFKDGERFQTDISDEDLDKLNTSIASRMRTIGIEDGEFVTPQVNMYVEAVPVGDPSEGELRDNEPTILRVHVFDMAGTPYPGLKKLLGAMLDRNLATFGEPSTDSDDAGHVALEKKILQSAADAGLISTFTDSNSPNKKKHRITVSPADVKRFIQSEIPTLRYGSQAGAIKDVSVSSLHDPSLMTVNMQRVGFGDPTNLPGTDGDVVPLQMLPTELEVKTLGCPILAFGQQFFVDMDTNTTVDNIYGVTGISHKIEPGSFETSFKMINIDAYGSYRSAANTISQVINDLEYHGNNGS